MDARDVDMLYMQLRAFYEDAKLLNEERINSETPDKLLTILQFLNELKSSSAFANSKCKPLLLYLDTKVFQQCSTLLKRLSKSVDFSVCSYEPETTAKEIKQRYLSQTSSNDENEQDEDSVSEKLNWDGLSKTVQKIMKFPPTYTHMNSVMDKFVPKSQKEKSQREKQQAVVEKQPEKVSCMKKEDDTIEDTLDFMVWALRNVYKKNNKCAINYLEFVADPDDFTASVSNIFYLSFLLNDGRVTWHEDDDNNINIEPTPKHLIEQAKEKRILPKQFAISINWDQWQKILEKLHIKNSILKSLRKQWDSKSSNSEK